MNGILRDWSDLPGFPFSIFNNIIPFDFIAEIGKYLKSKGFAPALFKALGHIPK